MATVYLAEDLKHDRKVALKLLKPELAAVLGAERAPCGSSATGFTHMPRTGSGQLRRVSKVAL